MAEIHLPTSLLPLPVRPPPWAANANVSVHLSQCASSDLPSVKLSAALECLAQVGNASQPHRFEVWTDGSVSDEGTGGSGFLIIEVTDGRRVEVASGSLPAGQTATSFTAEAAAALAGLQHVAQLTNRNTDVVFVSDSRSVIDSLRGDPYYMSPDIIPTFNALSLVARNSHTVHLVWVSSHCGLRLNDRVDRLANDGTKCPQHGVALPVQAAKTAIRQSTAYDPPLLNSKKLGDQNQRAITVTLNQLLTGHCKLLRQYLHRIEAAPSPDCNYCTGTPEDAHHLLLQCPGRARSRQRASLDKHPSVKTAITKEPSDVVRFLQLEELL